MIRGLPLPTDTHRAVLKSMLVDNPYVDGQVFALAYGSISRIPVEKINSVTQRQLLDDYQFPAIFVFAEAKGGGIK
jgi:hypothetical protein